MAGVAVLFVSNFQPMGLSKVEHASRKLLSLLAVLEDLTSSTRFTPTLSIAMQVQNSYISLSI